MNPTVRAALAAILLAGAVLRVVGLDHNLPDATRTTSGMPDEMTYLYCLQAMDPGRFDFNPKYFHNPSAFVYLYAATLKMADLTGLARLVPDEAWYHAHRSEWARIFLVGRLLQVAIGVLSIHVFFLLGRRFAGDGCGLATAGLLALLPAHIAGSHFATANLLVLFFSALAVREMLLAFDLPAEPEIAARPFSLLRGALWTGLAIGTKYSAGALLPFLLAAEIRWRLRVGEISPTRMILGGGAVLAGFLVTTPYLLLDPRSFFLGEKGFLSLFEVVNFAGGNVADPAFRWTWPWHSLVYGWSPLVAWGAALAVGFAMLRGGEGRFFFAAFFLVFYVLGAKARDMATAGRLLPMALALPLLGEALASARPRVLGGLSFAVLVPCALAASLTFLTPTVQDRADTWLAANLPAGATVYEPRTPYWWSSDDLYMSYWNPEQARHRYRVVSAEYDADTIPTNDTAYVVLSHHDVLRWAEIPADQVPARYRANRVFVERLLARPGAREIARFDRETPGILFSEPIHAVQDDLFYITGLRVYKIPPQR